MPRRVQSVFARGRRFTLAATGDSLTHNITLGVRPDLFWPEQLAAKLRAAGADVKARNFGVNGNTTTSMLSRAVEYNLYDTPNLFIIFGGVNDPGASISGATTTANLQAIVKYLKNAAKAVVTNPSNLPAGSLEGDRYIVTSDNSTTGGVAASGAYTGDRATVTGTQAGVQVWEARNALAGESGYSRVASLAIPAVARFILIGPQFLNYTSGADTAASGGSHSGQNATYAGVDTSVRNAATNEGSGTVYCDIYDFMQQRILAGKDGAASASWHVAGTNQHLNAYGEDLVAQAVLATIQAQSGWVKAFT